MSSATTSSTVGPAPTGRRKPADRRRHDGAAAGYPSARRAFRIIDRVSHGGDGLDAKALARALGISRFTCYQMLGILIDEGYLRRLPEHAGYELGPELERHYERSRSTSVDAVVGPVLGDLAQRVGCSAYFGLLSGGALAGAIGLATGGWFGPRRRAGHRGQDRARRALGAAALDRHERRPRRPDDGGRGT